MPRFSQRSHDQLESCDERLRRIFEEVIRHWDCTVIQGHRSLGEQAELYRQGRTTLKSGSKHNHFPSLAVDAMAYPIDWDDWRRNYYFAGFVLGVASQMGIGLRHGGDWDRDRDVRDHTFLDMPHFELVT